MDLKAIPGAKVEQVSKRKFVDCHVQSPFHRLRVSFSCRRLSYWPGTDTAMLWVTGAIGGPHELAGGLLLVSIPLFTGLSVVLGPTARATDSLLWCLCQLGLTCQGHNFFHSLADLNSHCIAWAS